MEVRKNTTFITWYTLNTIVLLPARELDIKIHLVRILNGKCISMEALLKREFQNWAPLFKLSVLSVEPAESCISRLSHFKQP